VKIIVSGSLAYDRIMDFPGKFCDHILPDKLHVLNVCFAVNGMEERFGGTAGNIAYNLSMLGEKPIIVATAGKDFNDYEKWLIKNGLSLEGIRRIPEEMTAGAYITTDRADNQITGFNPGAMKYPSLYNFDSLDGGNALAIIAPGNLEDMVSHSRTCKEKGIPYIFDPGQSITALSGDELRESTDGSKLLISNDYELEMIMKSTGLDRAGLLKLTEAIITTLGESGSIVYTDGIEVKIPASPVSQVTDPTGAGDSFRAGLIKGMVNGKSLVEAARLGSVSAGYSVECQGTQCHFFSEEQFWARFESCFGPVESAGATDAAISARR
jgi:adenosine kinase